MEKQISQEIDHNILLNSINKNEIANIIYDIVYRERLHFFESYTLPSMLYNRYAPAFGWNADFRNEEEYMRAIDEIYNEQGFAKEYIINDIVKNIKDYKTEDELKEDLEWFSDIESIAEDIFDKFSIREVIDFLAPKVEKDLKDGKLDIGDIFDRFFFYDHTADFLTLIEDSDQLIELAKKYKLYDKLVNALQLEN